MKINSPEEAFEAIAKAAEHLGWNIAFKSGEDDDIVNYVIIGTDEELQRITGVLDGERHDVSKRTTS